ncbi:hypothetical protein PS684_03399 [Pseudomonas fluorescens]|nr:hypothetical protein PS681_00716 [Pseudomonas fluorescens]VVN59076.1 hypothetical protein PS684_03399 [Pseudomonas fluorescens]
MLSWQTFVALNWPANADGSANTSAKIGAPGQTVWESWKESYEIFLPQGQKPVAWNQKAPLPAACQGKGAFIEAGYAQASKLFALKPVINGNNDF